MTWSALSCRVSSMCGCICCSYTMSPCAGAVSLRGSNGCLIRLWTVSVSFQPTTDLDMSRKSSSPFLPLGLKPFHLIVWWNMHLQRLTYFPSGGNWFKEMKRNFLLLGNHKRWPHCAAVYSAACPVMKAQKKHISATRCSMNLMPEGTKFNQPEWT